MSGGSDATASFAMDLGVTGAEGALSSADALEKLQKEIKGGEEGIAGLQKALRLLKGDTVGNAATITKLKDQIKAQRATVAAATGDYVKLGGEFKKTAKAADASKSPIKRLKEELASNWKTVAVVAAVAAITAAGVATAKFALTAADARRSEELQLEGLTKLRYGYGALGFGYQIAADKASFLQTQIDKVSSNVAIGRDQVAGYEQQLYKMGLRAGNLQAALEGASITASAQGDAAAQTFIAMSMSAGLAGGSIRKFADDAKARLGGIVARQMLSLDVQTKKLHENLNFLFGGVKIEGFLKGLSEVTNLFSANTESGKALKQIIETIFNPFFEQGPKAGLTVKHAIQDMIIVTQNLIIALFPVRKAFHDAFGSKGFAKDIGDTQKLIGDLMVSQKGLSDNQLLAIGVVNELGSATVDAFKVINYAVNGVYYGINAAVNGVFYALNTVVNIIGGAFEDVAVSTYKAGTYVVKGIAAGIAGGAHWVFEAIGNLADNTVAWFEKKLKIRSPSQRFADRAVYIPLGQAKGIDKGAPAVQRAVERMQPNPDDYIPRTAPGNTSPAVSAASAQGNTGAGGQPLIGALHLHTSEKTDEGKLLDFTRQLVQSLRAAGVQMGAPV